MQRNDMFQSLVGQSGLKKALTFYAESYKRTNVLPFILLEGERGSGKSQYAKTLASNLTNQDGSIRPMLELNCATIKSAEKFFAQVFLPVVADNEITIFFDECHNLPECLTNVLLTALNTEVSPYKEVSWRDHTLVFDFTRITVLFATTEIDRMFGPLKDRLTCLSLEPYDKIDIATIIERRLPAIKFETGVLGRIAATCRGNARSAVLRCKEIQAYCETVTSAVFSLLDWEKLKDALSIKPMGLTSLEMQVLKILGERGACSLQTLASVTGMSRSAIQHEVEVYLLRRGLMQIDGKRAITESGRKVLEAI